MVAVSNIRGPLKIDELKKVLNTFQNDINALCDLFPQGVVAIDLETTGLSPLVHEIIEIAAIKIKNGKVEYYEQLVKPNKAISDENRAIHGISNEMVKDSPPLEKIINQFLNFSEDCVYIAHNAKFDLGHIIFALHKLNIKLPNNHVFCSCDFMRKCYRGAIDNFRLSTLSEHFSIPLINHHRALDDALACLIIFAKGVSANKNVSEAKRRETLAHAFQFALGDFNDKNKVIIPKHLTDMIIAIEEKIDLEIVYKGGSLKGQLRTVTPQSIIPMPLGPILYARCHIENIHKSFVLSKISDLRLLK